MDTPAGDVSPTTAPHQEPEQGSHERTEPDGPADPEPEEVFILLIPPVHFEEIQPLGPAETEGPLAADAVSNDPSIGSLWGMQATGGGSKAVTAWANNYTGSTRSVVGVVDSGVDYTHPDLYLNIWLNQGEIKGLNFYSALIDTDNDGLITFRDLNNTTNRSNSATKLSDWNANGRIDAGDLLDSRSGWEDGIDFDTNGYVDDLIGWDFVNNDNDPMDDNGHGTHVAGTIGAVGGNGVGVAGVNWQVQIAALKLLNSTAYGTNSNAILATDYFTTAKIKSDQRGESGLFVGTNHSWGGTTYNSSFNAAIDRANAQGLLVIASAGNGGTDSIGDNNDLTPQYPASYTNPNVIAVASLTSSGSLSSFSNYGPTSVDLAAPGSSITSTLRGGGYGSKSGTSMAAPHVTGAAALLKSAFPQATGAMIKQALLTGTAANAALAGKTVSGGQLDVMAALNRLAVLVTQAPPVVSVTATDASASETAFDPAQFTFTRSGDLSGALTVNFTLTGTASSADFSSIGTGVTFAAGAATATLTLTPVDDALIEGSESLTLSLVAGSGYTLAGSPATATISDNDFPPSTPQELWGSTGNDTLSGGTADDRIGGVPASGSLPGKGSVDRLTGLAGGDTLLLADSRGTFYNDGLANNQGTGDYALITDFNALEDHLQLSGKAQYLFRYANGATEIFLGNGDTSLSKADELIARLDGVNLLQGAALGFVNTNTAWASFV